MQVRARRPAVFLDRDGVINRKLPGAYVTGPEEFRFTRGGVGALRRLKESGRLLILVTNQRGIARGFMSEADLERVHRHMQERLAAAGAALDGIFYCPHDVDEGCRCRKPRPGMLRAALGRFPVDTARSCLVGDSLSDIEAAAAAGIGGLLIVRRGGERPPDVPVVPSFPAAVRLILAGGCPPPAASPRRSPR